MLLAEDLLLLLTDDETGKTVQVAPTALAGAVMMELALLGNIDVAGPGEEIKEGRLVVRDAGPTGSPILDRGLAIIGEKVGRKPESAIQKLSKDLDDDVAASLAARGILRREESRVLGIFPTTKWPAEDSSHEQSLRAEIASCLAQGQQPTARSGALISLLSASGTISGAFDAKALGLSRRELEKSATTLAAKAFAPQAVKRAVEAMHAAMMVSVMVATTAAAGST